MDHLEHFRGCVVDRHHAACGCSCGSCCRLLVVAFIALRLAEKAPSAQDAVRAWLKARVDEIRRRDVWDRVTAHGSFALGVLPFRVLHLVRGLLPCGTRW